MFSFFNYLMGHTIKGQTPREYRPSATRRASGLSPINEGRENARRRWNRLRQSVKRASQIQRNIRTKGSAKRGRFTMKNIAPPKKKSPSVSVWRNTAPGIYIVSQPYRRGRFKVETIHNFVPFKN
jgi:hypothetical protein